MIRLILEDLIQQTTPKGSDCLGLGKHGAKTYQEAPQVDYEYPLEAQEVLIMA